MHRLTTLMVGLLLGVPCLASAQSNQTVGDGCWSPIAAVGSAPDSGDSEDLPSSVAPDKCSNSTAALKGQRLTPGQTVYFTVTGDADGEDNTNANADDGDRDSGLLLVKDCYSLTTQAPLKMVGDSNAFEGILMATNESGTISTPVCADIDADGDIDTSDCAPADGDTGMDQDGGGTATNNSLFWDWGPPPGGSIWWDTTVSPGATKVGRVMVTCNPFLAGPQ